MKKDVSNKKKMSTYQKSLLIVLGVLVFLSIIFLCYVYKSLLDYEHNDIDNYMNNLIKDMKKSANDGKIDKYIKLSNVTNEYEKNSSLNDGYKELFNGDVKYNKVKNNVYVITSDNNVIATVTLDDSKTKQTLSILTYTLYDVKSIEADNSNGLYNIDLYVNSNETIKINGFKINEKDLIETVGVSGYEEVTTLKDAPVTKHYHVSNLTKKPEITITDNNGKNVDYEINKNVYSTKNYLYKTDDYNEAMSKLVKEYNPLEWARNYSLFMTDDLGGEKHGFNKLSTNLINGTSLYKRCLSWATGVDITFMAEHRLAKETFTNEKMSNFVIYNDKAFSVEIYLEENFTVNNKQQTKIVNKSHDTYYYLYVDGVYKLVSTSAVTGE